MVVAEIALDDVGGQAQRGQKRQDARRQEVQRRHQRPQEHDQDQEVHQQCGQRDPAEVADSTVHGVERQRRIPREPDPDAAQSGLARQPREPLFQRPEVVDGHPPERIVRHDDHEPGRASVLRHGDACVG